MTTAYTSLLGLALPVTGELQGTWGDTVNNSITSLLDTAVAGTTTISTDGDVTLSTTTGAANQARQAIILCSGARTALRTLVAPAQSKIYTVINATTGGYSVKLVGAGPTTGVTIVNGESAVVAWNGSDFIKVSNTGGTASFTNITVSGTTTLSGLTASTALALDASKNVVSVTNTGTGNNVLSASPTLTGTISGAGLTLSSDLTLSGGTANGVLYLNGSKVATSGSSLTFDGTNLGVPAEVYRTTASSYLRLSGGDGAGSGANVIAFGQSHATAPGRLSLSSVGTGDIISNTISGVHIYQINSSEQMRLTSTGLGIGTSSPGEKLQVAGAIRATGAVAANATGGILAYQGSSTVMLGSWGADASTYGAIQFYQANSTGTINRTGMLLDSSGNLGIGTSSPLSALGFGQTPSATGITFQSTDTTFNSGKVAVIKASITGSGNGAMVFETYEGGSGGGERMRLTASGNLGLGVTPSGWAGKAFQIGNASNSGWASIGYDANGKGFFATSAYNNTASSWAYTATGFAATLYSADSGAHKWYTAPSGTAGAAITFTQAMTLSAAGGLSVGITTDAGSGNILVPTSGKLYGGNTSGSFYSYVEPYNTSTGNMNLVAAYSAAAITFATGGTTERARIDSSGNLQLGTSGATATIGGNTNTSVGSAIGRIAFQAGAPANNYSAGIRAYVPSGAAGIDAVDLRFYTSASSSSLDQERARIDSSGNLLVGTTSSSYAPSGIIVAPSYNAAGSSGIAIQHASGSSSGYTYLGFIYDSGVIGSVSQNGTTGVLFNTTSDYRLKTLIASVTGSGARLDALNPVEYEWKANGKRARGFFAHEFQSVYADSVTGEKDAVDEEGKPVYQAMQASTAEVIADLVAEIKSLRARVATLEAKG